ncbi:hypothetical protein PVAP13_3NG177415 [Panicum virgatum]|uniref:Uncharacterized protein n=1 Tax=Panicum virgatum TaxID=38727 RepID=A0A8T0U3Q1_PANVG|nr:hypothetical protein PVAP13_3NG177415 [Panicum virgatum]
MSILCLACVRHKFPYLPGPNCEVFPLPRFAPPGSRLRRSPLFAAPSAASSQPGQRVAGLQTRLRLRKDAAAERSGPHIGAFPVQQRRRRSSELVVAGRGGLAEEATLPPASCDESWRQRWKWGWELELPLQRKAIIGLEGRGTRLERERSGVSNSCP